MKINQERLFEQSTRIPLQEWIKNHPVETELLWRDLFYKQVRFVTNRLVPVFGARLNAGKMALTAFVIATYHSKSIELPVYELKRPDLRVVLRNNFTD